MKYPLVSKSSREIAFTKADEGAFSRLLREQFGEIAVVPDSSRTTRDIPVWSLISECPETIANLYFADTPGWLPRPMNALGGRGYVITPSRYWMRIVRSRWLWSDRRPARWAWDPPTLQTGTFATAVERDDQDAKRFVQSFWRLLDKFSCRQFKIEYPHLGTDLPSLHPEMGNPPYDPKKRGGSETRAGADALLWCQQKPGRMIDGRLRPADGWTFPEWLKPYYREEEMAETDRMTETPPEGMC